MLLIPLLIVEAKKLKYPISSIPTELKHNADAVIREKHVEYEIISPEEIILKQRYAVSILKQTAAYKGVFKRYYNKLSSVNHIEANIYDASGKLVKRITGGDILDRSAISGFALFSDSRMKIIVPEKVHYPYTVEYSFQQTYKSVFYLNSWYVYEDYNTAIQQKSLLVTVPQNYEFRYKCLHIPSKVKKTQNDNLISYYWTIENVTAPITEPMAPPLYLNSPVVLMAPSEVTYKKYSGNFNSWSSFGDFFYQLNNNLDNIPTETITKVSSLLHNGMSDKEKVAAIYKFAQDKNRYVYVGIGIGGIQPYDAETVDRLSYGDCKGLSNYTYALLKKFGYNPLYTLAYAGNSKSFIDPQFPRDYFNHALLCLPLNNDTIWLECTNSQAPCGYIGNFTDDRHVLLAKETGGELVKTPTYTAEENSIVTHASIQIMGNGAASAEITSTYNGCSFGNIQSLYLKDEADRRKTILKSIQIPNFSLKNYSMAIREGEEAIIDKKLNLSMSGYYTIMGSRIILPLNTINKVDNIPPYSRNRKKPLLIKRNYREIDAYSITLPNSYKVDAIPDSITINTDFGLYHSSISVIDTIITYNREFKLNKGLFDKSRYNDFVDFMEKIMKYDNAQALLSEKR